MFSLKFTCLIRTSVNTDNRQFLVSRITNSHISSTPPRFADTVFQRKFYRIEYLCKEPNRNGTWWLAALDCLFCHNHVLIVHIVPCINIDRFSFYICLILMSPPIFLNVFDYLVVPAFIEVIRLLLLNFRFLSFLLQSLFLLFLSLPSLVFNKSRACPWRIFWQPT